MARLLSPRLLAVLAALVLLALLPALVGWTGRGYLVGVATNVLIFAIAAASLNVILGYGGMVSLGHAAFFGTGAYVVGILAHHAMWGTPLMVWPLRIEGTESAFIAWPLAVLVAALLAFVIGAISLRTTGLYFIMITLAFAQMLFFFFIALGEYGGEDGMSLWNRSHAGPLDLDDNTTFYYVVLVLFAALMALKYRLVHSRFGVVLAGIRDNPRRMRALGYPVRRYQLAAFTLAGAVAGLAGALIANQTEFVSPTFLHWTRSGEILIMVVLGGMGTLFGPVLGAAAFLLLEETLADLTEHWMIVFGPLLLLVVLFARGGLWSLIARLGALVRRA